MAGESRPMTYPSIWAANEASDEVSRLRSATLPGNSAKICAHSDRTRIRRFSRLVVPIDGFLHASSLPVICGSGSCREATSTSRGGQWSVGRLQHSLNTPSLLLTAAARIVQLPSVPNRMRKSSFLTSVCLPRECGDRVRAVCLGGGRWWPGHLPVGRTGGYDA